MKKEISSLKSKKDLMLLDNDKLNEELKDSERERYILRMKRHANELKQTHLLRTYNRYIALLKMLIQKTREE